MCFELGKLDIHKKLKIKLIKFEHSEKKRKLYYTSPKSYLWYETLYIKHFDYLDGNKIIFLFRYLFENKNQLTPSQFQTYFKLLLKEGIRRNFEIEETNYKGQINSYEIMYIIYFS